MNSVTHCITLDGIEFDWGIYTTGGGMWCAFRMDSKCYRYVNSKQAAQGSLVTSHAGSWYLVWFDVKGGCNVVPTMGTTAYLYDDVERELVESVPCWDEISKLLEAFERHCAKEVA